MLSLGNGFKSQSGKQEFSGNWKRKLGITTRLPSSCRIYKDLGRDLWDMGKFGAWANLIWSLRKWMILFDALIT